jgi:hypothetical protein
MVHHLTNKLMDKWELFWRDLLSNQKNEDEKKIEKQKLTR